MKLRKSTDEAVNGPTEDSPPIPSGGDSRRSKAAKRERVVGEVPLSSFNFVADYWAARARQRTVNLTVLVVMAVIVAGVGLLSFQARSQVSDLQDTLTALDDEQLRVASETKALTGGIDNLPEHLRTRRTEVLSALAHDIDVRALATNVRATVPAHLTIKSFKIDESGTVVEGKDGDPPLPMYSLSVTVTGNSYADVRALKEALERLHLLNVEPVADGTPEAGLTITVKADVPADLIQSRRFGAAAELDASGAAALLDDPAETEVPDDEPSTAPEETTP